MSVSGTATRPDGRVELHRPLGDALMKAFGREGECFCWMQRDIPVRLQASDLRDPKDFHRRLSDWLMQQR